MWFVYMLKCRDSSYYTGVTKNVSERLARHNSGKGAKYTRARRPCSLIYVEKYDGEIEARRRERELKGWNRAKKERLIGGFPSSVLSDLLRISGQ